MKFPSAQGVLCWRSSDRVGNPLDKALYDSCHLLRMHLNHCNQEAISLGISGLLLAMFAKQPLEDVVLLQCRMFAVQYAYASSWISSGLKVDALVGHSFGELTALAVSGILELRDALIIVASRARFMDSKWGSERGTMLAIHDKAELVSDLIARLPQPCRDVEIACYNTQASHIVVGAEASVVEVERLLKTKPEYAGIKNQRLNVSYGFHAQFTEGFLDDLDNVANSVIFQLPKIHLETYTPQQIDRVSCTRISRHTREPIYFHQAVRRIEERLGPYIWLEAGIDSPIISMVKHAVKSPKAHVFQALKYDERQILCHRSPRLLRRSGAKALPCPTGASTNLSIMASGTYSCLHISSRKQDTGCHIWIELPKCYNIDLLHHLKKQTESAPISYRNCSLFRTNKACLRSTHQRITFQKSCPDIRSCNTLYALHQYTWNALRWQLRH